MMSVRKSNNGWFLWPTIDRKFGRGYVSGSFFLSHPSLPIITPVLNWHNIHQTASLFRMSSYAGSVSTLSRRECFHLIMATFPLFHSRSSSPTVRVPKWSVCVASSLATIYYRPPRRQGWQVRINPKLWQSTTIPKHNPRLPGQYEVGIHVAGAKRDLAETTHDNQPHGCTGVYLSIHSYVTIARQ